MDRKQFESKKAIIDKHRGYLDALMRDIEKEFAEAEKPELRHGDYGLWRLHKNDPFVFAVYINHTLTPDTMFYEGATCCSEASIQNMTTLGEFQKLGNIFDHLKAIAEPLTEFRSDKVQFKMTGTGELAFGAPGIFGDYIKDVPTFILNLQRLQYTERKKHEKA